MEEELKTADLDLPIVWESSRVTVIKLLKKELTMANHLKGPSLEDALEIA